MTSKASILVDIKDNAKKAQKRIKKNLKKIDRTNIRPNLNIDDRKEIAKTEAKLQTLSRDRHVNITTNAQDTTLGKIDSAKKTITKGDSKGVDASKFTNSSDKLSKSNKLESLKELKAKKLHIKDMGSSFSDPDVDSGMTKSQVQKAMPRNEKGHPQGIRGLEMSDKRPDLNPEGGTDPNQLMVGKPDKEGHEREYANLDKLDDFKKKIRNTRKELVRSRKEANANRRSFSQFTRSLKKFGRSIKRFTPGIMTWWKLIGMILPMVIVLAVQFAGVATAMGAVVGAGAAMMGLGLIGHGESMADSFALAERKMNSLKREMFQTFKPALQEFAPISDEFMANLPRRTESLVEPLRGLTVFEDTFIASFNGMVNWTGDLIDTLVEYADVIDQLTMRFGSILGDGILNGVEWLLETSYEEQDVMLEVLSIFKSLIGSIWQLLQGVTTLLSLLEPLFAIFHKIMKFLNNDFGAVVVSTIALMYVLVGTVGSLVQSLMILKTAGFASAIMQIAAAAGYQAGTMSALAIATWEAAMAHKALAGAMALTGVGALVVGGGYISSKLMGGPSDSERLSDSRKRTGGNGKTIINNEYNVQGSDTKDAVRNLEDLDHSAKHETWNAQNY